MLVVESDEEIRRSIRKAAEEYGVFRITEATDAASAVSSLEGAGPLAVILDVDMPGLDVHGLLDSLALDDEYNPYVITISADRTDAYIHQAMDAGAHFHVSKEDAGTGLRGILWMIIHHERTSRKLIQKDEELKSILETQHDMICRFLPDTTLTYVNKAYAKQFGTEPHALIGKKFLDLIPREEHQRIKKFLSAYSADNRIQTYRHPVDLPTGDRGWQEWTDYAFVDEKGRVTGFQSVGRDVTEEVLLQQSLAEIEKRERLHMSRELHDHVGQMLVLMKLRLENCISDVDNPRSRDTAKEVLGILEETMKEVRAVSRRMVAGFVKKQSLREALEDLVACFHQTGKISIRFDTEYVPEDLTVEAQTHLYRIMQEAVANTIKHAEASEVRVGMFARNGLLHLVFSDNGKGADVKALKVRNGFRTMRYRVRQMGGEIAFDSQPGSHFRIAITLPLEHITERG